MRKVCVTPKRPCPPGAADACGLRWITVAVGALALAWVFSPMPYAATGSQGAKAEEHVSLGEPLPDPRGAGGEDQSMVQVANLVYAHSKSSRCFADHFLLRADKESAISTSRKFRSVKLSSEELFDYPFVIMTGEGQFVLPQAERDNLRTYLEKGGFLLASAGCSSQEWDKSFRAEMRKVFPEASLQNLSFDHPVFHTVYDITGLKVAHGKPRPLEGLIIDGRFAVIYSADGLNDTGHAKGCCCCGGNEILNSEQINVNVLAYALSF
jgi:hypothetical protein